MRGAEVFEGGIEALPGLENQEALGELIASGVNLCQALAELLSVVEQLISVALAECLFVVLGRQGWARGEPFAQAGWTRGVGLKKADALGQAGSLEFGVSLSGLGLWHLRKLLLKGGLLRGADVDEAFALQAIKQDGLLGFVSDDKDFLQSSYRHYDPRILRTTRSTAAAICF